MIPILFSKNELDFTSNGLGRLTEATYAVATEERNGIFEYELRYPVTGKHYSQIEDKSIIYATHDDSGVPQPFRVYGKSIPIDGIVTFYARHIAGDLSKIITAPFTANSCSEALQAMKLNAANSCPFTFWTDKTTTGPYEATVPKSIKSLLGGEEGSILDVYGKGEYEYDKFTVKLHLNRGEDTSVYIRYGKNMLDLKYETDESDSYNAVAPFWEGESSEESTAGEDVIVTLPETIVKADNAGSPAVFLGVEAVQMDLSDQFEEQPTVAELRALAKDLLEASEAWEKETNIEIDFVQLWQTTEYASVAPLQQVKLCDTVNVVSPKHGVSGVRMKVIKTEYDTLRNRYTKMELGDPAVSFAQAITADTQKSIEKLEEKISKKNREVVKVEFQYCLSTSNSQFIAYGSWQSTLPTYVSGYYYWRRTATYYSDNSVEYGTPVFDLNSQLSAETDAALRSTNNHFWHDGTGAYVTEEDGTYSTGYATRVTKQGILQSFNGKLMTSWTGSGAVFYKSDGQTPLASYGSGGITFADDVPFTIGDVNTSCIRWVQENGVWKIKIVADSIEMGGQEVLTELDQLTIVDISYAYQRSTSGTTVPTGTWSPTPVSPTTTQYVWTRTTTTYSDGSTAVTYSVGGKTGTNGTGVSIESTSIKYKRSTSGTTVPSGSWSGSIPTVPAGEYLWTQTVVEYSDGHSTTSYSVAKQGEQGPSGTQAYITVISGRSGICVHNANNTSDYLNIYSGGIGIYTSDTQVATFSAATVTDLQGIDRTHTTIGLGNFTLSRYWDDDADDYVSKIYTPDDELIIKAPTIFHLKGSEIHIGDIVTDGNYFYSLDIKPDYSTNDHYGIRLYGQETGNGRAATVGYVNSKTSDIRLKENIEPVDGKSYIDFYDRLNPISFTLKPGVMDDVEEIRIKYGFSAQDIETAANACGLSGLVYEMETYEGTVKRNLTGKTFKNLDYDSLHALHVLYAHTLSERITDLESRFAALSA